MRKGLTLKITLHAAEAIRGESVFFTITLHNTTNNPMVGLSTFDIDNRSVGVEAVGPDGTFRGREISRITRTGKHPHGPEEKLRFTLAPGAKIELTDDLLMYTGEMPPGSYDVRAYYGPWQETSQSPPVKLQIKAANIKTIATPRIGAKMPMGPLCGASLVQMGSAPNSLAIFAQQQQPGMPRVPMHCVKVVDITEAPTALIPAASPMVKQNTGHVVWLTGGKAMMAGVNFGKSAGPAVPIKAPFDGGPLRSPVSLPDQNLAMMWTDVSMTRAAALMVNPEGVCQVAPLELGKAAPMGGHCCLWDYNARLHMFWAGVGGREVLYSRCIFEDFLGGFSSPLSVMTDEPVVWIDGYIDHMAGILTRPVTEDRVKPEDAAKLEEPPPRMLMAWIVSKSKDRLICSRANMINRMIGAEASFMLDQMGGDAEVISTAITWRNDLALLIKGKNGQFYYATSQDREINPLSELIERVVRIDQVPAIQSAGSDSIRPWVYLRYLDQNEGRIVYVKLSPLEEPDPNDPKPEPPEEPEVEEEGAPLPPPAPVPVGTPG